MPRPTEIAAMFASEMDARFGTGTRGENYRGFAVVAGRTYDKIVCVETGYKSNEERPHSTHAFISRATGDLIKAASWSAPQKNADNTLAVRYSLKSAEDVKATVELADRHGTYLYYK